MCLGAGLSQIPLIEKAVDMGLYVITVDYKPENPGHKISDEYVNCSTMDKDCVLNAARELRIDGITTIASNVAVPSVSFVAHELNLPGKNFENPEILYDKGKFRDFQRKHNLNCPDYLIAGDFSEIEGILKDLRLPLIFKPVDSSGSRGVCKLDAMSNKSYEKAFSYAKEYSHSGMVCVEEFIEGIEVGGDAFLVNSKVNAVITHKHINNFIPVGHELPTNISEYDQRRVIEELSTTCNDLNYTDGPLNFDVIVSSEGVFILEMSSRLGGNGIPLLVDRGTGVDFISTVISFSIGEEFEIPEKIEILRECGSLVFGSEKNGKLANIASEKQIKEVVPEVFGCTINYKIGDEVFEFVHSGNQIGYILFDCPLDTNYETIISKIKDALALEVT